VSKGLFVLTCQDARIRRVVERYFDSLDSEPIRNILAGASMAILTPDTREAVLRGLRLALNHHGVEVVEIIDHTDCLAYGKIDGDEFAFHNERILEAAKILQQAFPVAVRGRLIDTQSGRIRTLLAVNRGFYKEQE